MLKVSIFEQEQGGKILTFNEENRFYKEYPLFSSNAVVEFSPKGIAVYEDYEDDVRFLTFEEFQEQHDESLEKELRLFLYYVEDGLTPRIPYEEIVDEKVFKDMMQTHMLFMALSQSANQYHWLKLLLKRTKQTEPDEEKGNKRNFDSLIAIYLPEWEELYTGGGISLMLREFKDKNGKDVLVALVEDGGATVVMDEENDNTLMSKARYEEIDWGIEHVSLVYTEGEKSNYSPLAQDIFEPKVVMEIKSAGEVFNRIRE